jgi:hypothetical protein
MQRDQKLNSQNIYDPKKKQANEQNRTFSKEEVQKMKNCSPSLAIKEMQIKTTLRFHFIPVRIPTLKNTNNKCWQGYWEKEPLYTAGGIVS